MKTIDVIDSSGRYAFDLAVSVSKWALMVAGGTVRFGGEDLELAAQEHRMHRNMQEDQVVQVFIVRDKESGEVGLLVDEFPASEAEGSYVFQPDHPHELLDKLLDMKVPAKASSLEEAELTVRRIIGSEAPE